MGRWLEWGCARLGGLAVMVVDDGIHLQVLWIWVALCDMDFVFKGLHCVWDLV